MADGGACSSDPFRLPGAAEELTYPFGNGLVVRYGLTPRLVSSTASVAASAAEPPPSIEVPAPAVSIVSRVERERDGSSRACVMRAFRCNHAARFFLHFLTLCGRSTQDCAAFRFAFSAAVNAIVPGVESRAGCQLLRASLPPLIPRFAPSAPPFPLLPLPLFRTEGAVPPHLFRGDGPRADADSCNASRAQRRVSEHLLLFFVLFVYAARSLRSPFRCFAMV